MVYPKHFEWGGGHFPSLCDGRVFFSNIRTKSMPKMDVFCHHKVMLTHFVRETNKSGLVFSGCKDNGIWGGEGISDQIGGGIHANDRGKNV